MNDTSEIDDTIEKNMDQIQDGEYKLTETDAGVYLSVCAPLYGGMPVEESVVVQDLAKRRVVLEKSNLVALTIKEATGQEIRIADPPPQIMPDIQIIVRRDRLEAVIDVNMPPGASELTLFHLLDKLKSANVFYGIDEVALERIVKVGSATQLVCASGVPATDGDSAFLKYHIDFENQGRPVELEDGSVDFKKINSFITVTEGQLLIEKIPPTAGIRGIDVFAFPIAPKRGKDVSLPKGKNMEIIDKCRLVATIDGQVSIVNNRINVLPTIEITEDVDYATGNIDFIGNVIVHGSVQTGFEVKAAGNVEIRGTICGGIVEGANIIVRRGIKGMNRSVVKARERIVAKFVENATLYADQEIVISDVVLNSSIFAGSRVFIEGQRGIAIGGCISAGEEIRMKTVGNLSHIVTQLEVAVNPFLKEELKKLYAERKKLNALYEELKLSLAYTRKSGLDYLNTEKRKRYDEMEIECNGLPDRLDEIRQRITDIEISLHNLAPGKIRVSDVMYPGVKVTIGPLTKIINDSLKYLTLYSHEGEIKFSSFK